MYCGTKIRQTNAAHIGQWDLESGTWLQGRQLLDNSLDQVMVFAVSAGLQAGNVNLPVFRRRLLNFAFCSFPTYETPFRRSLSTPSMQQIPKPNI